jgi:hypothetical protein
MSNPRTYSSPQVAIVIRYRYRHPLLLTMHQILLLIIRQHHIRELRIYAVQVRLHPTSLHLSLAAILLANMAIEAVASSAGALLGAWTAFDDVLQHVPGLRFEFLVVVGASKCRADPLEMEFVARLLFVEARVVDGPFFLSRRADVGVDALIVFVEWDVAG